MNRLIVGSTKDEGISCESERKDEIMVSNFCFTGVLERASAEARSTEGGPTDPRGPRWVLIAPDPLRAPVPIKQHGHQGTGHVLRSTHAYGAAHPERQRTLSARWICYSCLACDSRPARCGALVIVIDAPSEPGGIRACRPYTLCEWHSAELSSIGGLPLCETVELKISSKYLLSKCRVTRFSQCSAQ